MLKSNHSWCEGHAEFKDGGWACKTTGKDILVTMVSRSIHDGPPGTLSGSGQVRSVGHLHCSGCNPEWQAPHEGEPVKPDELVEAGN